MTGAAPTAVPSDKATMRRRLREQRRTLAGERDRSADADAIASAVSGLLDSLTDEMPVVAIYRSLPVEPPTHALAEMLHARDFRVLVPETLPDLDLNWRELAPDGSEGPRLGLEGISVAALILTPALAVDHAGTRLGQGGGCYDRALARRRPDAKIVAIVNDQEYAAWPLPRDAHDVSVNAVITPVRGLVRISGDWPAA